YSWERSLGVIGAALVKISGIVFMWSLNIHLSKTRLEIDPEDSGAWGRGAWVIDLIVSSCSLAPSLSDMSCPLSYAGGLFRFSSRADRPLYAEDAMVWNYCWPHSAVQRRGRSRRAGSSRRCR